MGFAVSVLLASSAIIQTLAGPISDLIGRRPVILWSLAIFVLATIGCIYASSVTLFMIFRALQAIAASCMVLSRAIVRDTTEGASAASKIAYVTMGMSIVPMISPAIGGFLDAHVGWQANFWLLAITGAVIWIMSYFDQGETAPKTDSTLGRYFKDYPTLLKSQRFWGYALSSGLSSGAFFAYLGGAPFVGTDVFGMSPQTLGLFFSTPAVGYFAGNFISGRYSSRFGVDPMIFYGIGIALFGLTGSMAASLLHASNEWIFFGSMILVGLGNGMSIPNASAGMLSINPRLAGTASGLGGSIMIGLGAGLSAVAGLVLGPESTETAIVALMWVSVLLGLLCMTYVLYRKRVLSEFHKSDLS